MNIINFFKYFGISSEVRSILESNQTHTYTHTDSTQIPHSQSNYLSNRELDIDREIILTQIRLDKYYKQSKKNAFITNICSVFVFAVLSISVVVLGLSAVNTYFASIDEKNAQEIVNVAKEVEQKVIVSKARIKSIEDNEKTLKLNSKNVEVAIKQNALDMVFALSIAEVPGIAEVISQETMAKNAKKVQEIYDKQAKSEVTYLAQRHDSQKPNLTIIMDDIYAHSHLDGIKKLGLNITPSIFPKNDFGPDSANVAYNAYQSGIEYMVHLPLEAQDFYQKEYEPLKVDDSYEYIQSYISALIKDFPNVKYINNHTGSKFTKDRDAMERLLSVLDSYNISFIDSITTYNHASERISSDTGRLIMFRDVFLDNQREVSYIKNQIKKAIKDAKSKGYAIAICHPHKETFTALRELKDTINASVNLVSPQNMKDYLVANKIEFYQTGLKYARKGR